MVKYNLDKLVKVKTYDFTPSVWYKYIKGKKKKYFWQTEYIEGVYNTCLGFTYVGEAPKNHVLKDGVVLEKPEVELYFQSGIETSKFFDSLIEAERFVEELTNSRSWILID